MMGGSSCLGGENKFDGEVCTQVSDFSHIMTFLESGNVPGKTHTARGT